jgi:hypothetical protein
MMNQLQGGHKLELNDDCKKLASDLVVDVFESMKHLQQHNESQFYRRTFVRSFFSFLEGWGRILRSAILESERVIDLSPEWQWALRDERVEIEQNGRPNAMEARFPFANLFASTIRAWAILNGWTDDQITKEIFGDNGWSRFRQSLRVRHALTHPKLGSSIDVSDEELTCAFDAFKWFGTVSLKLVGIPLTEIDELTKWPPSK